MNATSERSPQLEINVSCSSGRKNLLQKTVFLISPLVSFHKLHLPNSSTPLALSLLLMKRKEQKVEGKKANENSKAK